MKTFILIFICCLMAANAYCYNRQDSLRGSNGNGRSWWDVQQYDLSIDLDTAQRSIRGDNIISLKVTGTPHDSLQIDLQEGMFLDKVEWADKTLNFIKDGNVYWVTYPFTTWQRGSTQILKLTYHGQPHEAINPPWDGGFIWTKDSTGKPCIAVACQGFGASSWWPCKDYQGDEPDNGMKIRFTNEPYAATAISNGRFMDYDTVTVIDPVTEQPTKRIAYDAFHWEVRNPINTYNATFYIGDYVHWHDTLLGEKGRLDLDFYALKYNETKARKHFAVTKQMLHCFEYWMGPYPFYEDGYKLVEAPYLGMEHQSAVAYGNAYQMGYRGMDRSGTGVGLKFDYLIVHESGHEWFGNNITTEDITDNWVHEGITTYSETLFAECLLGKAAAFEYARGEWKKIQNDRPVIGDYGVNSEGSSDRYDKGAAVMHMIRMMLNDDERFRQLLRGLNRDFYHKIVTSAEVEAYISRFAGKNLQPFFDQYLRTTRIPILEWYRTRKTLHYRFANVPTSFEMPVMVQMGKSSTIMIGNEWHTFQGKRRRPVFSKDFLVEVQKVGRRD